MTPLYLNALGIVNPLGTGKAEVARNLFAGSQSGMVRRDDLIPGRPIVTGVVAGPLPTIPERFAAHASRTNRLLLAALREIEDDVRGCIARHGEDRVAVLVGTSTSGIAEGEEAVVARLKTGAFPPSYRYGIQLMDDPATFAAAYLGISGPAYAVSTACTSSVKALGSACRLVRAGMCDAAVVAGTDGLCRLTTNGFAALEALSDDVCVPLSRNRKGINIGEGAAAFLVTRDPGPVRILGIGETSDAHHISAPDPEGTGTRRAMDLALTQGGIAAREVAYVNLHGTGTPMNDAMEAKAVSTALGGGVPCSSTKPLTGHMLGAAGASELGFLWLTLSPAHNPGFLPPHVWDGMTDDMLPQISVVGPGTAFTRRGFVPMLTNSMAFGGNNVSVLVGGER